jgi:hypothetical protein
MPHVTSMLMAGLAAVGAWGLVIPSADSARKMPGAGAADIATSINRARKGDRMTLSGLRRGDERILFQSDPLSNVTIVAKGVVVPELTVRETMRSTPARIEVPAGLRAPRIPVGCDPVVSAIAEPGLSRHLAGVTGHCVSQREDDVALSVKSG